MAANENIGAVTAMYLKSIDQAQNEYETNISKGFEVNPAATFAQVDTAARALNSLSNNSYSDTTLITEVSVNMKMAE